MVRYVLLAAALKLFSASPQTKRLYRLLGNKLGARRKVQRGLPSSYVKRAKLVLRLCEKHPVIQKGDRLLEVGTGWLHWDSIVLRLFYDVEITLFDVWDNRQLEPMKRYFAAFAELIDKEEGVLPREHHQVSSLLEAISSVSSFEHLYDLIGFQYVIEPAGKFDGFRDQSFNAILSWNVLEHVKKDHLSQYVGDFYRLLVPGGYSIHMIDLSDHLAHYDQGYSRKDYLRFADTLWKRFFENEVQYFNRVQRAEWLSLFRWAGLELVDEESRFSKIEFAVDRQYEHLDMRDLECTHLRVLHRKPLHGRAACAVGAD